MIPEKPDTSSGNGHDTISLQNAELSASNAESPVHSSLFVNPSIQDAITDELLAHGKEFASGITELLSSKRILLIGGADLSVDASLQPESKQAIAIINHSLSTLKLAGLSHIGLTAAATSEGEQIISSAFESGNLDHELLRSEIDSNNETFQLLTTAIANGIRPVFLKPADRALYQFDPGLINEYARIADQALRKLPVNAQVLIVTSNFNTATNALESPSGTTIVPLAARLKHRSPEETTSIYCANLGKYDVLFGAALGAGNEYGLPTQIILPNSPFFQSIDPYDPFLGTADSIMIFSNSE